MKNTDLQQISQLLDKKLEPVQKELKHHGKLLQVHRKLLRNLKKDQGTMLNMLDTEQIDQRKRLKKVEHHLGMSSIV